MSKSRITNMAVSAGLILASLAALTAIGLSAAAKERGGFYAGMGELQRFEQDQSVQEAEAQESSQPYTGMADWRRFEVQQSRQDAGEGESSNLYAGMGDLHLFEAR